MTRRERLERKIEKREEWAGARQARANAVFREAEQYRGDSAFNTQPGHIPERARLIRREERAHGDLDMAAHHRGAAAGIARQLEGSVFSDDTDAMEQLEARIAEREREAAAHVAINRAWRKGGRDAVAAVAGEKIADTAARTMSLCSWLRAPLDTTNIRASIRRDKARMAEIEARQARAQQAAMAPGGALIAPVGDPALHGDRYIRVTFAEKPTRATLDALKGAGFRWGGGAWIGERAQLPKGLAS